MKWLLSKAYRGENKDFTVPWVARTLAQGNDESNTVQHRQFEFLILQEYYFLFILRYEIYYNLEVKCERSFFYFYFDEIIAMFQLTPKINWAKPSRQLLKMFIVFSLFLSSYNFQKIPSPSGFCPNWKKTSIHIKKTWKKENALGPVMEMNFSTNIIVYFVHWISLHWHQSQRIWWSLSIVTLKNVFIRLRIEKVPSVSEIVIEVVTIIYRIFEVSIYPSWRLLQN